MFGLGHHNSYSPKKAHLPKIRFSIAWLLLLTALIASLSVHVANYLSKPIRLDSRFPVIDGSFALGRFVDLASNDRLIFRIPAIDDGGAEIERVKDEQTVWIVFMEPSGMKGHSFFHDVSVEIDNWETTREIEICGSGSSGQIIETRNIDTGVVTSRSISW